MLRHDLEPLDVLLADALLLEADEFLDRHRWPVLVFPDVDPVVLRALSRPETLVPGAPLPALYEILEPGQAAGASLDALCVPARPKDGHAHDRITVGRAPEADVVLLDETISKLHAEISWDAATQRCVLTDLASRNGTYVDDVRLPSRGHADLTAGSVVAFGSLVSRYYAPRPFLEWLGGGANRAGAAPVRKRD